MAAASSKSSPSWLCKRKQEGHVCRFTVGGHCLGADCPYTRYTPTGRPFSRGGGIPKVNLDNCSDSDIKLLELIQRSQKARNTLFIETTSAIDDDCKPVVKDLPLRPLKPPADESVKTLFVGRLHGTGIKEQDLKDHFGAHGEIESIKMEYRRGRAFVAFTTREGAEKAAEGHFDKLVIKDMSLNLMWLPAKPGPWSPLP